jgi:hypothetical protein
MIFIIFYFLLTMYNIISNMFSLPNDLLVLISYNLNLSDIVSLKQTNTESNTCFNDLFFKHMPLLYIQKNSGKRQN